MAHKSQTELRNMLQTAATKVVVGGMYAHYKQPELTYKVAGLVIWEATDEVAVLYEAQYGERITFARALDVWLEKVAWQGETVPRFSRVEE